MSPAGHLCRSSGGGRDPDNRNQSFFQYRCRHGRRKIRCRCSDHRHVNDASPIQPPGCRWSKWPACPADQIQQRLDRKCNCRSARSNPPWASSNNHRGRPPRRGRPEIINLVWVAGIIARSPVQTTPPGAFGKLKSEKAIWIMPPTAKAGDAEEELSSPATFHFLGFNQPLVGFQKNAMDIGRRLAKLARH